MDLQKVILAAYSKAQVNRVVNYIGSDPKRFEKLVNIYLEGPYRVTQRAAASLSYCVENHPELIVPHLKKILDQLRKPDVSDAVKRNTVRLLQFIEIPKRYHGLVAGLCFQYLENKKEPVAVKVFSMTVLLKVSEDKPELRKELRILIEDQLPYTSPAFVSRAKKTLKELK